MPPLLVLVVLFLDRPEPRGRMLLRLLLRLLRVKFPMRCRPGACIAVALG